MKAGAAGWSRTLWEAARWIYPENLSLKLTCPAGTKKETDLVLRLFYFVDVEY